LPYVKQSAGSDDENDEEVEEDDELAFVQQHLYEGGEASDDEAGNAEYKFSDFFVADKSERRLKARAAGKDVKNKAKMPVKSSRGAQGNRKLAAQSGDEDEDEDEDEEDYQDDGPFSGEDGEGEDWEEESEVEDEEEGSEVASGVKPAAKTGKVTATQQRNQALSSQIADLEEELMGAKPWELRGEVKASDRPENSFLELHADIERFALLLAFCILYLVLTYSLCHTVQNL